MTSFDFLRRYPVVRFPTRSIRAPERLTLADFVASALSSSPKAASKETAPAWALCNDTGDSSGTPNGLIQVDFDHVRDVPRLRTALSEYGGFLFVCASWSGCGTVAIGDVGRAVAAKPDAVEATVYAPLRQYLRSCGIDAEIDPACNRASQLRYETRDASAWVSPVPTRLVADAEALAWHPISALAAALCPQSGPAGLAAALGCIGMTADLRSRMAPDASSYPARAWCVVIGEPGCGKTTLLSAVQDVARQVGVTVSDPKNAPTLRDHIMRCGCDEVLEVPPEGGKPQKRMVERTRGADPLMVCVDEAGQRLRTRVADESCGSLAAMLRQCNGDKITLEATVKQEHLGSYRVPAHVAVLLGTTLPQWAEYVAASRQENGEARRVAEFLQPARAHDIFVDAAPAADVAEAVATLTRLRGAAELWADSGVVFEPAPEARSAVRAACAWLGTRGLDAPSAQSLVMCYATLCAGLRASIAAPVGITLDDVGACLGILGHVLEARAMLAQASERKAAPQSDSAVWAEILAWVERTPRRDKILERIARRPPQYRRVYREMLAAGSLIAVKDGARYVLRPATGDELERTEEAAERPSTATGSAKAYVDCSRAERDERLLAYYTKFREDHAVRLGNRNSDLSALAFALQRADMWDDAAKEFFADIAEKSGLGKAEIRKLMRPRKILEKN